MTAILYLSELDIFTEILDNNISEFGKLKEKIGIVTESKTNTGEVELRNIWRKFF